MVSRRYQHGHIRRVPRAGGGYAWKYYYRQTDTDGVRRLKAQTFQADKYPTEASVWKAIEGQLSDLNEDTLAVKAGYTMGQLCTRYLTEYLPTLAHSTQDTNRSHVLKWIKPRWANTRLADLRPLAVKQWLDSIEPGPATKKRIKDIISSMLDLAMLWEVMPHKRNPMELVHIKGATKRQKEKIILTMEQFLALVRELAAKPPLDLIVYMAGVLGLRVSEVLAFQWRDIDEQAKLISVRRVFTHNRLKEFAKTDAGNRNLPLHPALLRRLKEWKNESQPEDEEAFIFPGEKGTPYSSSTMMQDHILPAAKRAGIPHMSWHPLRHSHKTWLASERVQLEHAKDLLGHADISTTANDYGKTLPPEMRRANKRVVDALLKVEKKTANSHGPESAGEKE